MEFSLIRNGKYLLVVSLVLFTLGLIALLIWHLKLGIDFTGGTVLTYDTSKTFSNTDIIKSIDTKKIGEIKIQKVDSGYSLTVPPTDQDTLVGAENIINKNIGAKSPTSVNTIGPVIGKELTYNAIKAVAGVAICIILYIAFAFRAVSHPVSSWVFGLTAVIAMVHDVVIVLGAFALFGVLFGASVDSLFVTALLTVIGFSVHDTIVVFDRIRENLAKKANKEFETIVNDSLIETLGRSLNTSLTVILILLSLFLLGGESIRWFVLALLIGVFSGTYSSIFVASQLLILYRKLRKNK